MTSTSSTGGRIEPHVPTLSLTTDEHTARLLAMRDDTTVPPHDDDIVYPGAIPFALVHLVCFAAIWTGITTQAVVICIVLFVIRMFGVSAGYHRYFSHRSFKTSRAFQFALAWLAQSSAQRGVLWWAARHRHHHKHSDTDQDVHSPRQRGFWYAHVGWIFVPQDDTRAHASVPDLASYPELSWLTKHQYFPATILGIAVWCIAGWPGLIVGFFWSTVILYHVTFMINSLAHVHGSQPYLTGDDSRNNWWLALLTLGEGWHNNHHAYMSSARQGFRWREIDITYYILKALSAVGLVWDLNEPPVAILNKTKPPSRGVLDKVVLQLVATYPTEQMTASTIPTQDEVRHRAQQLFAHTPSHDDIVKQAWRVMVATVQPVICTGPVVTIGLRRAT